jgi:hypothetical protein
MINFIMELPVGVSKTESLTCYLSLAIATLR